MSKKFWEIIQTIDLETNEIFKATIIVSIASFLTSLIKFR